MKILVTSGTWQASLACVQSLGRAGHDIYLIDSEDFLALSFSKYCKGQFRPPSNPKKDAYAEFLLDLVKKNDFDIIIPISDNCVLQCAQIQNELRKHVHFLMPDKNTISLASSKAKTCQFAIKHNIPIPKTYFPSNIAEVERLSQKHIFPCVVKIPISSASNGVFFINNKEEMMNLYQTNSFKDQWPIIQELIDGDFFGVTAVANEGTIIDYFMFAAPYHDGLGGTLPIAFSIHNDNLLKKAREIISALNWSGPIAFDYIKKKNGDYLLIEINPRFSGTLNFAYRLKVDLPLLYCQLALKENKIECKKDRYSEGTMYRSIFSAECTFLYDNPKYIWKFLIRFLNLHALTNIYWDDFHLTWWQIKETKWILQTRKNKKLLEKNLE